jgi:hypothetical protein
VFLFKPRAVDNDKEKKRAILKFLKGREPDFTKKLGQIGRSRTNTNIYILYIFVLASWTRFNNINSRKKEQILKIFKSRDWVLNQEDAIQLFMSTGRKVLVPFMHNTKNNFYYSSLEQEENFFQRLVDDFNREKDKYKDAMGNIFDKLEHGDLGTELERDEVSMEVEGDDEKETKTPNIYIPALTSKEGVGLKFTRGNINEGEVTYRFIIHKEDDPKKPKFYF